MKRTLIAIWMLAGTLLLTAQDHYVGTTMNFSDYLEKTCGIIFKEDGIPTDPYQSISNHGANIVRLTVGLPPFSSSYSEGQQVDHHSAENVKIGMQRARDAGLRTLLTFTYQSFALEDENNKNIYVAPLAWQEIALDLDKITDSVYNHTYSVLDDFCSQGLVPEIVSIGGESSWHRLMPNVPDSELPTYDPARSVAIHNAGSMAVRDIATKYDRAIKVCFHMRGPSVTQWWLEAHWPYGPDLDMIGISLYHGWNDDDYAGYPTLGDYVTGIIETYGIEFLVMETAQLFTEEGNDVHVDLLGTENIPTGYPNPPTTETQKNYLVDLTREVLDHGGSGVIVWGGEWVASDCYIYADQWGKGSSWENKTFWDFEYNLHDGVNWMMPFSGKIPVTFKVQMEESDTSNGVFVTGDFENFRGETWTFNQMYPEGNKIYYYTAFVEPGTSGTFYFLNDTTVAAREIVPMNCADSAGADRFYDISDQSKGEVFAYVWNSCDTIQQYALSVSVSGEGTVSPSEGIYSSGVPLILEAAPWEGWLFSGWTGDTISTENPIQVRMDAELSLTATFIKKPEVLATFKVDMKGVNVSNGVYVTGEFPNQQGKTWQLNQMTHEGDQIYSYSTWISSGDSGAYYFMNDDVWGVRESVPSACAVHWGSDRGYEIPQGSTGETFAFVWSSCEEIDPVAVNTSPNPADENFFKLYPNPLINNQLRVIFHVSDQVTVSILTLTGSLISETDLRSSVGSMHTVDLKSVSSGLYIVKFFFKNRNQFIFERIVI